MERSEPLVKPGTIIPSEFGEHLFKILRMSSFHMHDAWKTKFIFARSNLTCGIIRFAFINLELLFKIPKIDIRILYLIILRMSINV